MLFAALLSDLQLILLGLSILVIAFVLYRGIALSQRSARRDFAAEARAELRRAERAAASGIENLEVRLHDYGREIEGRVETTRTMLDRLILDAEQESTRLSRLLNQGRQIAQTGAGRRGPDIVIPAGGASASGSGTIDSSAIGIDASVSAGRQLTPDEREMVRELQRAGYSVDRIARFVRCPSEEIMAVPQENQRTGRSEAA